MRTPLLQLLLCLGLTSGLLLASACGTRGPALVGDSSTTPRADGSAQAGDLARDRAPRLPPSDYGVCARCKAGEVYLMSSCVATDRLFTCGSPCDPAAPGPCPIGFRCETWGGTPCCYCSAIVPACIPLPVGPMGFTGPLRIQPTSGTAGQEVKLTVEGARFYVGALWYSVRMGKQTQSDGGGGDECRFTVAFTPPSPGIYPVEVSQYGGGLPWVLAGFYTASGGIAPIPAPQPGEWCGSGAACASAPPYSCGCVSGRCVCK